MMRMRAPKGSPFPRMILAEQNPNGHNFVWGLWVKDSLMRDHPHQTWTIKPEEDYVEGPRGEKMLRGLGAGFKEWERIGSDGSVFYTIASGPQGTRSSKRASSPVCWTILRR